MKALAERGFRTIPETAEETIRAAVEAGVPVERQRLTDPVGFQMDLLKVKLTGHIPSGHCSL